MREVSKLLCSRQGFEQRSDNFSAEKFSELAHPNETVRTGVQPEKRD